MKRGSQVKIKETGVCGKITKVWPESTKSRAVYMVRPDNVPKRQRMGHTNMHFAEELIEENRD